MSTKRVLIIGLVWPEPTSSAAGTRIVQLIRLFLSASYEVIFASAASKSAHSYDLKGIGVTEQEIRLNDSSFNVWLKSLMPDTVMFDRFMTEEQYGWRVQQECPDALKILDTEDLHCLRYARQQAMKSGIDITAADLYTDLAKREIAALLRCDLSLIISETEMQLLQEKYQVAPALIYYLPFLEEPVSEAHRLNWHAFEQREGFVFIGNFLHEPNWHTLQVIKTKIWPGLRKKLPAVAMHIYGAYPAQKVMQLHNARENFLVHGRAPDARTTISRHRVLLAPIQFGAGVKGKFIDAMQTGTPSVTTSTGAEAMKGELEWGGAIADNPEVFIEAAAALYQDKDQWLTAQHKGIHILNERYDQSKYAALFIAKVQELRDGLELHRQQNFFGQILQHHSLNSSRYMSLWIEEKNKHLHTGTEDQS